MHLLAIMVNSELNTSAHRSGTVNLFTFCPIDNVCCEKKHTHTQTRRHHLNIKFDEIPESNIIKFHLMLYSGFCKSLAEVALAYYCAFDTLCYSIYIYDHANNIGAILSRSRDMRDVYIYTR